MPKALPEQTLDTAIPYIRSRGDYTPRCTLKKIFKPPLTALRGNLRSP
jgi:hypothetical protein